MADTGSRAASRSRIWKPNERSRNLAGLLWVLVAGIAVLIPALVHGSSFGGFDLLSRYGLTANPRVAVHNLTATDQINEIIPWSTLSWTQVHNGHLPLWNPYNALGLPLAFNWQSASFSFPSLVGYAFPAHLSFTVQIAVTLAIAGSGVYVLARVLGISVLASAFAGTVFELSGPMVAWLGWPISSVMAFSGWLFVSALLVLRGNRRMWSIVFLAVVLAAAVYAGQPDSLATLILMLAVFVAALLLLRTRLLHGQGPIRRPVCDLVAAVVAGALLAAPLALPGLQLTARSIRLVGVAYGALPFHDLVHLFFQSFDASATIGNSRVTTNYYPETAGYIGVVVLVLAVVGVVMLWRKRTVMALAAVSVVSLVVVFFPPFATVVNHVSHLAAVDWHRGLTTLALAVSVLAGFGMDVLIRSYRRHDVLAWLAGGFGFAALWVLWLWFVGRGRLPKAPATVRTGSFLWPLITTVLGLAVAGALTAVAWQDHKVNAHPVGAPDAPSDSARGPGGIRAFMWPRAGLLAAIVLFIGEVTYLLALGAPPLPSSPTFFQSTAGVRELQRTVGSSVVGFDTGSCANFLVPQVGILQETNSVFGVQEFSAYDPLIPHAYKRSWELQTHTSPFVFTSLFCPKVSNAKLATLYGVGYVLNLPRDRAPQGGVFVKTIDGENLYRMPGASVATLVPESNSNDGTDAAFPPQDATGRAVRVGHPDAASWKVVTDSITAQVLRLRLTDVPGWHATIDGRPLRLYPFADVMLQARIPPGRHSIELHYWPDTFTVGLYLGLLSALALACSLILGRRRRLVHSYLRALWLRLQHH
jgi:hypothetical protein